MSEERVDENDNVRPSRAVLGKGTRPSDSVPRPKYLQGECHQKTAEKPWLNEYIRRATSGEPLWDPCRREYEFANKRPEEPR